MTIHYNFRSQPSQKQRAWERGLAVRPLALQYALWPKWLPLPQRDSKNQRAAPRFILGDDRRARALCPCLMIRGKAKLSSILKKTLDYSGKNDTISRQRLAPLNQTARMPRQTPTVAGATLDVSEKINLMATYREIQEFVKREHNRTVKTCHIAHVKSELGLPMRERATSRPRKYPCPDQYRPWIEEAMRSLT